MNLYDVAWQPAVVGSSVENDPFSMRMRSSLTPIVRVTENLQLVKPLGSAYDGSLIIQPSDIRPEHKGRLVLGLRGDFAAIDRELEDMRQSYAQQLADTVIRKENERIADLPPLKRMTETAVPFDEAAPDFQARRQQIVDALLT